LDFWVENISLHAFSKDDFSFHVSLQPEEPQNPETIATLQLFVHGEEQKGFVIPRKPENPKVCRKERHRNLVIKVNNPDLLEGPSAMDKILVTYNPAESHRLKKNISHHEEYSVDKNNQETTIVIADLEAKYTYNVTVSYVTPYGSGEPSDIVQSTGTIDEMRKTDGCILNIDEKYKNGTYLLNNTETAISCAEKCAEDPSHNLGWSFESSTKHCFIHSQETDETMSVTQKTTNQTKTIKVLKTEFKVGWVTGTIACSMASDDMGSCSTLVNFIGPSIMNTETRINIERPWGPWGACSKSCGGGRQTRERSCSEIQCQCEVPEKKDCSTKACPEDGGWSAWSSYSSCSSTDPHTCGTKYRSRSCTKPPARSGGKPCVSDKGIGERDTEACSGGKKLPLKVNGHLCQEKKGNDTNEGQEQLLGCFQTPEDCLKECQEYTESTACEFNNITRECFIHKAHIQGVGEAKGLTCWLFIVSEMSGSCSEDLTPIAGNLTSAECLDQCQAIHEDEGAQGCQYDIPGEKCSYFTCPVLPPHHNSSLTCWTFNKGSFYGNEQLNCGISGLRSTMSP